MRLDLGEQSYSFSTSQYEDSRLDSLDYEVELLENPTDLMSSFEGTDTCITNNGLSGKQDYAEKFSQQPNVHFYNLDDQGYARAVELPTSEGEALAIDAVKLEDYFDSDTYRAGVNAMMKHAELMGKDMVLRGPEFFRYRWQEPLDLSREQNVFNAAEEVYFDEAVPKRWMKVDHDKKNYTKGEQWDDLDQFFVRWL